VPAQLAFDDVHRSGAAVAKAARIARFDSADHDGENVM
jgi:hypothetical protein